jgi:hypothetical protein
MRIGRRIRMEFGDHGTPGQYLPPTGPLAVKTFQAPPMWKDIPRPTGPRGSRVSLIDGAWYRTEEGR